MSGQKHITRLPSRLAIVQAALVVSMWASACACTAPMKKKSLVMSEAPVPPPKIARRLMAPAAKNVRFNIDFSRLQLSHCVAIAHPAGKAQCLTLKMQTPIGETLATMMREVGYAVLPLDPRPLRWDGKPLPRWDIGLEPNFEPAERCFMEKSRTADDARADAAGAFCLQIEFKQPDMSGLKAKPELERTFQKIVNCKENSANTWQFMTTEAREGPTYEGLAARFLDVLADCAPVAEYGDELTVLEAACKKSTEPGEQAQTKRACRAECAASLGFDLCVARVNTCRAGRETDAAREACDPIMEACLASFGEELGPRCVPECLQRVKTELCSGLN